MRKRLIVLTVVLLNAGLLGTAAVLGLTRAGLDFWTVLGVSNLSAFFLLLLIWSCWMFADSMKIIRLNYEGLSRANSSEAQDVLRRNLVIWAYLLPMIGTTLAITGELLVKDQWPWYWSIICVFSGTLAAPSCLFLARRLNG
jgi:hypothetical protein